MPGYLSSSVAQGKVDGLLYGIATTGSIISKTSTGWEPSIKAWAIGSDTTSAAEKFLLKNTTASTSGATVQHSPIFSLVGTCWKSGGTPASIEAKGFIQCKGVSSAAGGAILSLGAGIDNAANASVVDIYNSTGGLYVNQSMTVVATKSLSVGGLRFSATNWFTTPPMANQCEIANFSTNGCISIINYGQTSYPAGAYHTIFSTVYDRGLPDEDFNLVAAGFENASGAWTESVALKPFGVVHSVGFTVATKPTGIAGDIAYVSDGDTGAACLAVRDGTSWKRISLGLEITGAP